MIGILRRNPLAAALAILMHIAIVAFLIVGVDWWKKPEPVNTNVQIIEARLVEEKQLVTPIERGASEQPDEPKPDPAELAQQREAERQAELQRRREEEKARLAAVERERAVTEAAEAKRQAEAQQRAEQERQRLAEIEQKKEALRVKQEAEKRRLAELEKKRLAEEAEQQAELERQQLAAQEAKRKAEAETKAKQEAELAAKRKAEAKKKAELEAKRKAEAEAKRRAVAAKAEREAREAALLAQLQSEQDAAAQHSAIAAIKQKIERNWLQPPGTADRGLRCDVKVRLGGSGSVLLVQIVRSSGNGAFDRSVETAVYKSDPLPIPSVDRLRSNFREITFEFNPEA